MHANANTVSCSLIQGRSMPCSAFGTAHHAFVGLFRCGWGSLQESEVASSGASGGTHGGKQKSERKSDRATQSHDLDPYPMVRLHLACLLLTVQRFDRRKPSDGCYASS